VKQHSLYAHRYAKALFQIALAEQQSAEIASQLQTFAKQLEQHAELNDVFLNPVYSPAQRIAIISAITEKLDLLPYTRKFLFFLIEKKRTELFAEICLQYQELLDNKNNVVHVYVTSAQTLDDDAQQTLKQIFAKQTGRSVVLHLDTDPDLIGGMIARVGNRIYDGSVKSRFANMKNHLLSQIA
jgi:F-type H+-transporting ATPase subunit delta